MNEMMTSVEAWSLLLGLGTPFVVSLINSPKWTAAKRRVTAIVVAVFVGVMNLVVSNALGAWNDFTLQGVLVNAALVAGAAQAAYSLLWKPTGATDKVEIATSPKDARGE